MAPLQCRVAEQAVLSGRIRLATPFPAFRFFRSPARSLSTFPRHHHPLIPRREFRENRAPLLRTEAETWPPRATFHRRYKHHLGTEPARSSRIPTQKRQHRQAVHFVPPT